MRNYVKYFIFSAIWGSFSFLPNINSDEVLYFSDIINKFGFSEFYLHSTGLAVFLQWYLSILLFQVLFGTFIYRHFCSASVYYFSRCERRVRWFLKEAVSLYPFAILHLLIMVFSGTFVIGLTSSVRFDAGSFWLLGYYLAIHSLWLFLTTMLINIVAIKMRSGGAFVIASGIQIFLASIYAYWGENRKFDEIPLSNRYANLLKANPLSHLVLNWHSSGIKSLNGTINIFEMEFEFIESIALYLFLSVLLIAIGCVVVKRQEFIVINIETGGT